MNTVVIAADLGHFRAYRISRDPVDQAVSPRIDLIEAFDSLEGRVRTSELYTDSPGALKRKGGIGAGSGERHGINKERRRKLLKLAADSICSLIKREGMPRWHLSAGRSINNSLVKSLGPDVKNRLDMNLKADLTSAEKGEILKRFKS